MPGLSGLALTTEQFIEVISLYSAPQVPIEAVAVEPGWHVIGSFFMPATADMRLELIGCVSSALVTLSARFFCTTDGAVGAVAGSLTTIEALLDERQLSSAFRLEGGRLYQAQAQAVGAVGPDHFAYARRVTPAGV